MDGAYEIQHNCVAIARSNGMATTNDEGLSNRAGRRIGDDMRIV